MCHVYGLNAVLGQVLQTGAALVIGKRFDAAETLSLIGSEGITCVAHCPAGHRRLAWHKTASAIGWPGTDTAVGAGPLAEDIVREFESRTGHAVEQGYGLTEASPIVDKHRRHSDPQTRIGGPCDPGSRVADRRRQRQRCPTMPSPTIRARFGYAATTSSRLLARRRRRP